MKKARKIQVLRRIQNAINLARPPTPREVGLTEADFQEMAEEKLFRCRETIKSDDILSRYRIVKLDPAGAALLADEAPIGFLRRLRSGSWDILKLVLAAALAPANAGPGRPRRPTRAGHQLAHPGVADPAGDTANRERRAPVPDDRCAHSGTDDSQLSGRAMSLGGGVGKLA